MQSVINCIEGKELHASKRACPTVFLKDMQSQGDGKTRFAIICEARTGSNWLCGLLHSHPQILCHHEVFHAQAQYYAVGLRDGQLSSLGTIVERDSDPIGFLDRLWQADFCCDAIGFKLLAGQAPVVLNRVLAEPSVKKILLRRRSRLRAYLSLLRASKTGHWSHESYSGLPVSIETQAFIDYARRYDAFYAGLRLNVSSLTGREVIYEDLLAEPLRLRGLLEFLGVKPHMCDLRPFNVRQSNDSLSQVVINYKQLCAELKGSEFEQELEIDIRATHAGAG